MGDIPLKGDSFKKMIEAQTLTPLEVFLEKVYDKKKQVETFIGEIIH